MATTLQRQLQSLADLSLRKALMKGLLNQGPPQDAAYQLNELCEDCLLSHRRRDVLLAVAVALTGFDDEHRLMQLREAATLRGYLTVERLLRRGASNASTLDVEEPLPPNVERRRELTVGERRSLARRPDRSLFPALLRDPHPLVIRQLLHNPRLVEQDLLELVAERPARSTLMQELAQSERWLSRERLRNALLLHPGTPDFLAMPLFLVCTRPLLGQVMRSPELPASRRLAAREHLRLRPPWPPTPETTH